MSHWPCPPLSIWPRPPFFAWKPPKGFYPFIQAWDQNSRSGLGSVAGSVVSDIYWSISPHLSFSSLALLVHQKTFFLSCVLLLLSPEDEWHIRDSLQLILSFMLCESKLRACSPFTLYLLSFEIILNVMLDVRWELGAFLNFTQPVMCLSETEET